jgi:multiple sugar transport system ATP-binding protein
VATIVLNGVSKVFPNGVTAVNNVSLEVRDGEFLVLVGPSGCGKSTTLRMIAGLDSVSSGSISIDGQPVNDLAPKDRDLAMVFQNYALYPHLTAYENMAFGLKLRRRPGAEIDARVQDAARMLGISSEQLQRKPGALSGGQRQRVAVGRAIVRQPRAFLFDEPLSNLGYNPFPFGARRHIDQLVRHILLTEPLVDEFAALFAGVSDADIDALMASFRFEHCVQRAELAGILAADART